MASVSGLIIVGNVLVVLERRQNLRSQRIDLAKYLVDQGVDINTKRNDDNTALNMAPWEGHLEMVKYLVDHGANASCLDNQENSCAPTFAYA